MPRPALPAPSPLACLVLAGLLGAVPALAQRTPAPIAGPGAAPTPAATPALPPVPIQQAPPGASNRIAAVVNGDVVSRADVTGRARLFAVNAGLAVEGGEVGRLSTQVTRLVVDERLRLQEVQRRRIPVSDGDVADAIAELERRNGLPPGGLRAQLTQSGVQPRVLYDQIRTQIGWGRLIRQQLGPAATPSEEEVAEALRNARARIGQPEYLVSEIFIPIDNPAAEAETRRFVEDVVGQLRRGTPFPVAATQFSQAQTALQGGDLGWVRKDELDDAVAAVIERMPAGAISNALRVPGGFQIVTLRQKRETGRDMATILSVRQAFFPFATPLDPNLPTPQQREQVEKAQALFTNGRDCAAVERAARTSGASPDRPVDPGQIRLETVQPEGLRELLAGLTPNKPSQPVLTPDGVLVMMVCSREMKNLAEITPDEIRGQLLRDRVELQSRQLQRDLRRRATIEMRNG